ncbi:TadE family protein [Candidatus Riflebacteria bacterium]
MMGYRIRKSQALVEMAISLPLFLFIILTIIDGAKIMNIYSNLCRLGNLGANYATGINSNLSRPGDEEIRNFILTKTLPPLNTAKLKEKSGIKIDTHTIDTLGLESVTIKLRYELPLASPILTQILGKTYTISTQSLLPYQEI